MTTTNLHDPTLLLYSVRTRRLERRYRAGHCFGTAAVVVGLTAEQARLVAADAELVCSAGPDGAPTLLEAQAPHLVDTVDMGRALDVAAPKPSKAAKARAVEARAESV
jgi:hypothetical protein